MGFMLFLTQLFKMTKENRERLYKHMRYLENNYEARDGLNTGPTATTNVRKKAKQTADEILSKHPELEIKEEVKTKSKGKK